MADNSQNHKFERAKRVLAATMAPMAAVSGAVAAPSPEVRAILNNPTPAFHQSIPPQDPGKGIAKTINSMGEAWADAKNKAGEQSAKIKEANAAARVLKGISSSPAPNGTGKAVNALKGSSTSHQGEAMKLNSVGQRPTNGQGR